VLNISRIANAIENPFKIFYRKILYFLVSFGLIKKNQIPISFICEKKHWAIYWEGVGISNEINKKVSKPVMNVTHKVHSVRSPIIHFGSQYMWAIWREIIPKDSKVVVNFFHGKPEDGPEVSKHIEDFIKNHRMIDIIVVSNSLSQNRLISWGIPEGKLVKIYIGVDSKIFKLHEKQEKLNARHYLGFNSDEYVIGSFQKDGIGWGSGPQPKLIKGADIFAKTIKELAKFINVSVLLTGPSRGYIISELENAGIKFKHFHVDNYLDMPLYYHALDLYLITSREEGGPKGLLEAISSFVPVVSTPVGMCVDLLPEVENCSVTTSFEANELVEHILRAKDNYNSLSSELSMAKLIDQIDYEVIATQYMKMVYQRIYEKLIK
jgi:glycosyltransferase involved in cell wall biosynthesis